MCKSDHKFLEMQCANTTVISRNVFSKNVF
ncbi:hypothetical protein [Escherichia phage Es2]|nr:hypothetical protein [Escherichia phage Es2]